MTSLINLLICCVFISLLETAASQDYCKNEELKCTDQDPRDPIYVCMMHKDDWSLLCNQSKYRKLPSPSEVSSALYLPCANATAMYIDDSCLTEIRKDDLKKYPNLRAFVGGQNFIKKLPDRVFARNKKLEKIDLCGNLIEMIDPTAFSGLTSLRLLNLASNKLAHVPDFAFRELSSLSELSLHNNRIAVLHSGIFRGLRNLKKLKLTANRIGYIDPRAFGGLPSLTHLHLDENRLTNIDVKIFSKLTKLQVLTLSHNKIEQWPQNVGDYLMKVHTLDLGFNLITKFDSSHVTNMTKLQNLSLENNSLSSLSDDTFTPTPDLAYFNVADNYLEDIGVNAFSHLCHLETIIFRGNSLTTARADWFVTVVENNVTEGIDLRGNPWECTCNNLPYEKFVHDLQKRHDTTPDFPSWLKILQISCGSPKQFRGRVLDEITTEEIQHAGCATMNYLKPKSPCHHNTNSTFTRTPITFTFKLAKNETWPQQISITTGYSHTEETSMPTRTETNFSQEQLGVSTDKIVIGVISAVLGIAAIAVITLLIRYLKLTLRCFASERKQIAGQGSQMALVKISHDQQRADEINQQENAGFIASTPKRVSPYPQ